jgi:hypothetical protein
MPLSPTCEQYQFIGDYSLHQSNGFTVQFSSTGPGASGSATALDSSGKTALRGSVSGSITGTHVDFTIRWDQGPQGHYTGKVGADGFAHGSTNDESNPGSSATWDATVPLGCANTPGAQVPVMTSTQAPPPPAPVENAIQLSFGPPQPGKIVATVANSSELTAKCTYDASGLTKTHRDFTIAPMILRT